MRSRHLETDVCIIGGGPAGITIARELLGNGVRVIMVESGRLDEDRRAQRLTMGHASGPVLKDYSTYLSDSRRFQVQGSAAHWGRGWCVPFSRIDFEGRDWVDHSGWPFTASELAPFEDRAAAVIGIHPFEASASRLPGDTVSERGSLVSRTYHYPANPSIFLDRFLEASAKPGFRAELSGTAISFDCRAGRVRAVRVRRATGAELWIAAAVFVLAAGGIENARMLLLDQGDEKRGVAASRAVLGRYFMEHFHVFAGKATIPRARMWRDYLQIAPDPEFGHCRLRVLGLTDDVQRREKLLNATVQLRIPDDANRESVEADKALECELFVRAEQAPNPESRVVLDEDRDRLGRRRPLLRWKTIDQDWDSIVRSVSLVASELRDRWCVGTKLVLGRESPWPWEPAGPARSPYPTWGNHHIGTTRLDDDPSRGVVDSNCLVHGTSNLFLAGSSVFPTSSFANPTFTIVAMAIRLADYLKAQLAAGRVDGAQPTMFSSRSLT